MLKPSYKNRGGAMVQKVSVSVFVDADMLVNIVAHMIHMQEKITKASVEKSLRSRLSCSGMDGVDYLHESIFEAEREECVEQGKAKALELFPEFFTKETVRPYGGTNG